jgi:hypothetical protein
MEYYIYLRTAPYLADFIKHTFGDPVFLERDSPEARIIREFISKTPEGKTPDTGEGASLRIRIPFFKESDPRVYNYFGKKAQRLLIGSLDQLFEKSLIKEIGSLDNYRKVKTSDLIYAWMEKHGIPDNETNWYMISKKYYRLRKKYMEKGIKI